MPDSGCRIMKYSVDGIAKLLKTVQINYTKAQPE
jgi:hypothetical protein